MAVQAQRITVTEVATYLGTVEPDNQSIAVKNVGANEVRLGGKDVTWAQGYTLAAGESLAVDVSKPEGDALYAIAQTSGTTSTASILRAGA